MDIGEFAIRMIFKTAKQFHERNFHPSLFNKLHKW